MENIVTEVWSKSKVLIKAGIICLLIFLLLIPTFYIKNLIQEREARQREAITEVSQKWAGRQVFTAPILAIPFHETVTDNNNKVSQVKKYAYFLPEQLDIQSKLIPQEKHRGIY